VFSDGPRLVRFSSLSGRELLVCPAVLGGARMGKQGKVQASSWYDVRSKPLDPEVIKLAFDDARLIEYFVPTDTVGVDQGSALLMPADIGARTAKGIWVMGAHIAASDPGFEAYSSGLKPTAEGLFLYHFCSSFGCTARTQKGSFLSHISKFRVLNIAAAEKLPYGQEMLAEYKKSIEGESVDTGAGTGLDMGDSSGAEDAAVQQALQRSRAPQTAKTSGAPPPADGLNAHAIWSNALRGAEPGTAAPNTEAQIVLDRALANSLAKHLAAGDMQANVDLAAGKANSSAVPGASTGAGMPKFLNPALAQHFGHGPPPKGGAGGGTPALGAAPGGAPNPGNFAGGGGPPNPPGGAAEVATFPPHPPVPKGRAGEEMGKRLAEFASRQAAKRALEAPSCPQTKVQRLVQNFAELVGGSTPNGSSTEIVPWEAGGDDVFGSSAFGGASTSVLAAARPGDLFAASLQRIRDRLSAIHGDSAMAQEGRRLVTFYHEVIFKPKAKADFSYKMEREMVTLVEAIDALLEGSLDRVGDVLMGRYKALEDASTTGSWAVAREFEAVAERDDGLVTDAERQRAVSLQLRRVRLQTALRTVRGGGSGAVADG